MIFSKSFFDIQLQFAFKVARLLGLPLEKALLDYTNLYIRFGLGREFDHRHLVWREYPTGLANAVDAQEWTYRFVLKRPHNVIFPSVEANFGCFSYTDGHASIRLHFQNSETKERSPLSKDCLSDRLSELRSLFEQVKGRHPATTRVFGTSWLYNLPAYRRLFPPSYLATAKIAARRFRNMSLWGQFLDRNGVVRPRMATTFQERLSQMRCLGDVDQCFSFQPLMLEAPVQHFYDFYDL